jgi:hypothetical protein
MAKEGLEFQTPLNNETFREIKVLAITMSSLVEKIEELENELSHEDDPARRSELVEELKMLSRPSNRTDAE